MRRYNDKDLDRLSLCFLYHSSKLYSNFSPCRFKNYGSLQFCSSRTYFLYTQNIAWNKMTLTLAQNKSDYLKEYRLKYENSITCHSNVMAYVQVFFEEFELHILILTLTMTLTLTHDVDLGI